MKKLVNVTKHMIKKKKDLLCSWIERQNNKDADLPMLIC